MITWQGQNNPEEKQKDLTVKINPDFASRYIHKEPLASSKPLGTLEKMKVINQEFFIKTFKKSLIQHGICNAMALLEMPVTDWDADNKFLKEYALDKHSETLQAVKYQRDFLYSIFNHQERALYMDDYK